MIFYNLNAKSRDVNMLKLTNIIFQNQNRNKEFILLGGTIEIHAYILPTIAIPVFKTATKFLKEREIDINNNTVH